MVRTVDLVKHYKDPKRGPVHAVDGVSIHAVAGEIFGLLGVNGAGKTTLLRVLSTVLKPSKGIAEVAGFDVVNNPREVRKSIGFLSTSTALYGRLTAREMIEYFGGLYGLHGSTLSKRVDEVVEQLDLHEFQHRLCDKLSTGQKQRTSIARTILHDPPVLFFDEPTAGLDVVTSQRIMKFIEDERTRGKTLIFSTHIMSEVERLCDRVAIIDRGVVRAEGTVPSILSQTDETKLEAAFLKLVEFNEVSNTR
jgi:sodium transport system ATP-binding protein